MDPNRKAWNDQHKQLRRALERTGDKKAAIELFMALHAAVHSTRLSNQNVHSFENEILSDLSLKAWRFIPQKDNHSIAWIIWHLARVEDVTMNLLVSGSNQILHAGGWIDQLQIKDIHTGNGMSESDVAALSGNINIKALVEYRLAVGRKARKIATRLNALDYSLRVNHERVRRIWEEDAMLPNATGIVNYWANLTIAGLILMPSTRHCFLHLNEARRIRSKLPTKTKL